METQQVAQLFGSAGQGAAQSQGLEPFPSKGRGGTVHCHLWFLEGQLPVRNVLFFLISPPVADAVKRFLTPFSP